MVTVAFILKLLWSIALILASCSTLGIAFWMLIDDFNTSLKWSVRCVKFLLYPALIVGFISVAMTVVLAALDKLPPL